MLNIFGKSFFGKKAPELLGAPWLNQQTLPPAGQNRISNGKSLRPAKELAEHVTLVNFWDYSCINCINSLPYLRQWWERYRDMNFMVIGIHTPEFAFAADPEKVRSAVLRFNLSYPVVSDPEYKIWEDYNCKAWPRFLLVDARGKIRYDQTGAGNFQEIEKQIQKLLRKLSSGHKFSELASPLRAVDVPGAVCKPVTPKLYLGWRQGQVVGEPGHPKGFQLFINTQSAELHKWVVQGAWRQQADEIIARGSGDKLKVHYLANDVSIVMRSLDQAPDIVEVWRDGRPLTEDVAGPDIVFEDNKSFVYVRDDRLYNIVADREHGDHELTLQIESGQVAFHNFSFGTSCI